MEKRIVRVPAALRGVMPRYLENRAREQPAIEQALAADEWERLRVSGHNLKGTGAGYGLPDLSRIGALLEEAAKAKQHAAAEAAISELRDYLASLEVVFG